MNNSNNKKWDVCWAPGVFNDGLNDKAPSADDFEEVAVVVYFPKLEATYPGQQEMLLIKARISTLAISGMTPDEASSLQEAEGSADPAAAGAAGLPGTSGK